MDLLNGILGRFQRISKFGRIEARQVGSVVMGQKWFETKFAWSAYGEGALSQKMGSFEKRMKK